MTSLHPRQAVKTVAETSHHGLEFSVALNSPFLPDLLNLTYQKALLDKYQVSSFFGTSQQLLLFSHFV